MRTDRQVAMKTHPNPMKDAPATPYAAPDLEVAAQRQLSPDEVRAALRAARWRLLLPFMAYMVAFVVGAPLLVGIIGPWGVVVVLVVCVIAAGRWADAIWACPRCARPLGRSLTPNRCMHCGQEFGR